MAYKIRRVITGHDRDGKAVCVSDDMATEILQRDSRPGVTLTNFWQSKPHLPNLMVKKKH